MAVIKRNDVYLYSRYSGRTEVYQGYISPFNRYGARFTYKRAGKDAYLQCPFEAGVVRHSVLWLSERDDQKAKELFIEHERNAICELQEKIKRREWNIKLLEEEDFAK